MLHVAQHHNVHGQLLASAALAHVSTTIRAITTACVHTHSFADASRTLVKLTNDTLCVCLLCAPHNVQSRQQAVVDLLDDSWEEVRSAALSLLKALLQPTAATGRCADLQSFVAFAEGYDKVCIVL
jgi:hypothetical protein